MKIVLSWVQGCWKWTQAGILIEKYGFELFETWVVLRALSKEESELWKEIKSYIDNWIIVPDTIIWNILDDFLSKSTAENVLFDGIPRTIWQKKVFDEKIWDYKVVYFNLPKEVVLERLQWRTTCNSCWTIYSWRKEGEICEKCWWTLTIRSDDKDLKAIETRINSFYEKTMPLIEDAIEKWQCLEINANLSVPKVTEQILEKLNLK